MSLYSANVCLLSNVVHCNSSACFMYSTEIAMHGYSNSCFLTLQMVFWEFMHKLSLHHFRPLLLMPQLLLCSPLSLTNPRPRLKQLVSDICTCVCAWKYNLLSHLALLMCVLVYECVYVCVCGVCLGECMYLCMCACMRICVYVCMGMCACV